MTDVEKKQFNELILKLQELEKRVTDLENGEFGTGVYLDGCTEADAEYISGKPIKKEGE